MQTSIQEQIVRFRQKDSDIIEVIEEDHNLLKKLIKVMKDSDIAAEDRFGAYEEFAILLIAHFKPEEETLYTEMKKNENLREEAFEGVVEHMLADQLVEEIKKTTDKDLKAARIKVLAEIVEHHIEDEEERFLPSFKKESDFEIRKKLGNEFLKQKVKYLAAKEETINSGLNSEH